jgi:formylmethanofuran dehydrogenase subunit A
MAFDPTFRTSQEYLNMKAGFTGELRSKQECLRSLAARPNTTNAVLNTHEAANSYAGTSQKTVQSALNNKVGNTVAGLTKQEAVRRI